MTKDQTFYAFFSAPFPNHHCHQHRRRHSPTSETPLHHHWHPLGFQLTIATEHHHRFFFISICLVTKPESRNESASSLLSALRLFSSEIVQLDDCLIVIWISVFIMISQISDKYSAALMQHCTTFLVNL